MLAPALFPLGGPAISRYSTAPMKRTTIEFFAKAFIVALSAVFLYAFAKVLGMMGIW